MSCAPIWPRASFDFAAASDNCLASKLPTLGMFLSIMNFLSAMAGLSLLCCRVADEVDHTGVSDSVGAPESAHPSRRGSCYFFERLRVVSFVWCGPRRLFEQCNQARPCHDN